MTLEKGKIIQNRYRIVSLLGKGGFGAVYRAWDTSLEHPCALKENLETSDIAQRQFEREARVLANLNHPNLPRVTDHFVIPDQGQYLVMDYVPGMDLEQILAEKGPVEPSQALEWVNQISDALTYLHNQNPPVLHRDIKPSNIRIRPNGNAMLVDFGLVKIYDPHLQTTLGARAVTPGYAPPEQYGHGLTDARADVYALSATLYTLLTGDVPPESVQRMGTDSLIPANGINPQVSGSMAHAISTAMSLTPSGRYQTIRDFKAALNSEAPAESQSTFSVSPPAAVVQPNIAIPRSAPQQQSNASYKIVGFAFVAMIIISIVVITYYFLSADSSDSVNYDLTVEAGVYQTETAQVYLTETADALTMIEFENDQEIKLSDMSGGFDNSNNEKNLAQWGLLSQILPKDDWKEFSVQGTPSIQPIDTPEP